MAIKTLTSANSIFLLSISSIYPQAQQIQGFASDSSFLFESVNMAETVVGVDGLVASGYTPYAIVQTVSLMPTSDSLQIFETWTMAQKTAKEIFYANGIINIPSISRKYSMVKGVLTSAKIMPDVKKILQGMEFKITWTEVTQSFIV